jgi:cyclopropane fatty-acyl-phospholipid synthase-like methyltransferase
VSWLTILHITDRKKLFRSSNEILKTGGTIYLEDFYELHPMNDDEKRSLQEDVFCRYLPSLETYKNDIESNGFELVKVDEMTDDWKRYTAERLEKFDSLKDSFVKIHGQDVFDRLRYFYCKVSELFQGGNLGGVRIVAKKK